MPNQTWTRQAPPAAAIPANCLHEAFRLAEDWERNQHRPVYPLHVGEPCFDLPSVAVEALTRAVVDGRTAYTSAEGMLELRVALTEKLVTANGHDTTPEHIFVTPGSCQGLTAALQSIVSPGDELLLPELHWPIHLQQALLVGFRPLLYPLRADLTPDLDWIAEQAGHRVRAMIVNSPANPSGAMISRPDLEAILALANDRDWLIISDEAYEHFAFDAKHLSPAKLEADRPRPLRRVISTFSFSKSYAMTGCRLGYVVMPNDATAFAMRVVQEASIIAPATPVQYAGLAALGALDDVAANHATVRKARDSYLPALAAAGILPRLPAGGWYAVLDVERTGLQAERFAHDLLVATDIVVTPAPGFALRPVLDDRGRVTSVASSTSAQHLIRIAICGDHDLLSASTYKIADFVGSLDIDP